MIKNYKVDLDSLGPLKELNKKNWDTYWKDIRYTLVGKERLSTGKRQDLLHILELNNLSIIKRLKISFELTKVSKERRLLKDLIKEVDILMEFGKKSSRHGIEKAIILHRKLLENRRYRFRNMTEEEIVKYGGKGLDLE